MTVAVGAIVAAAAAVARAQDRTAGNPGSGDPAAVRAGTLLFRERCTECHGADAKGVPGHDLTRLWTSGVTDTRVFQTIREGVPNSIMPSMAFEARTGKNLWFYPTGSPIWGAAAMTYMLDGKQQVLIGSGTTVMAFALPDN